MPAKKASILLETQVALIIIVLVISGLLAGISAIKYYHVKSKMQLQAQAAVTGLMEKLKAVEYNNLPATDAEYGLAPVIAPVLVDPLNICSITDTAFQTRANAHLNYIIKTENESGSEAYKRLTAKITWNDPLGKAETIEMYTLKGQDPIVVENYFITAMDGGIAKIIKISGSNGSEVFRQDFPATYYNSSSRYIYMPVSATTPDGSSWLAYTSAFYSTGSYYLNHSNLSERTNYVCKKAPSASTFTFANDLPYMWILNLSADRTDGSCWVGGWPETPYPDTLPNYSSILYKLNSDATIAFRLDTTNLYEASLSQSDDYYITAANPPTYTAQVIKLSGSDGTELIRDNLPATYFNSSTGGFFIPISSATPDGSSWIGYTSYYYSFGSYYLNHSNLGERTNYVCKKAPSTGAYTIATSLPYLWILNLAADKTDGSCWVGGLTETPYPSVAPPYNANILYKLNTDTSIAFQLDSPWLYNASIDNNGNYFVSAATGATRDAQVCTISGVDGKELSRENLPGSYYNSSTSGFFMPVSAATPDGSCWAGYTSYYNSVGSYYIVQVSGSSRINYLSKKTPSGSYTIINSFPYMWILNLAADKSDGSCWVGGRPATGFSTVPDDSTVLYKVDQNGNQLFNISAYNFVNLKFTDISIDNISHVCWMADKANNRVLKITDAANISSISTGFNSPQTLCFDGVSVWVAHSAAVSGSYKVVKLNLDGTLAGVTLDLSFVPKLIRANSQNKIFIVGTNNKIYYFNGTSATPALSSGVTYSNLNDLAVDSNNLAFILKKDNSISQIGKLKADCSAEWQRYGALSFTDLDIFHTTDASLIDDDGSFWIADKGFGRVKKINKFGVQIKEINSADSINFDKPSRIAVDSLGNVWVLDSGSGTSRRVVKLDKDGNYASVTLNSSIANLSDLSIFDDIAVDLMDNSIRISYKDSSSKEVIIKFDSNGNFVKKLTTDYNGTSYLNIDSGGNTWPLNTKSLGSSMYPNLDSDTAKLDTNLSQVFRRYGPFYITDMFVDSSTNMLWLAELLPSGKGWIRALKKNGCEIKRFKPWGDWATDSPISVSLDSNGNIWYGEILDRHNMVKLDAGGNLLTQVAVDESWIVRCDKTDNSVWVVGDSSHGYLSKYDYNGTSLISRTFYGGPIDYLEVMPYSGKVFFASKSAKKCWILKSNGTQESFSPKDFTADSLIPMGVSFSTK